MPARCSHLLWMLSLIVTTVAGHAQEEVSITQLRASSTVGAAVKTQGTVTVVYGNSCYIQDAGGALLVLVSEEIIKSVTAGDVVRVSGTMMARAGTSDCLRGDQVVKLGTGALPEPQAATLQEILDTDGAYGQRVRVTGAVHDVALVGGQVRLDLRAGASAFTVQWHASATAMRPDDLLDSLVEVTGVMRLGQSPDGKTPGGYLLLASAEDLRVIAPGSADVFTRPLHTLASLRGAWPPHPERCRVIATVTYSSVAGWFCLQDETGTASTDSPLFLKVPSDQRRPTQVNPAVVVGDVVELIGAPRRDRSKLAMPWLMHSEWRILRRVTPPPPVTADAAMLLAGEYDGQRVSISGAVVDSKVEKDADGFFNHLLTLEDDGIRFTALVQRDSEVVIPVQRGDYLALDGVVTTLPNDGGQAQRLRIHLSSFDAVQPTWVPLIQPQLRRWLLGALAVLLGAVVWISVLRVQVRRQTALWRAVNEELERFIARDISDRQRVETQLRTLLEHERELLQLKSSFINTISHEFRTPLGIILFASSMLRRFENRFTVAERAAKLAIIDESVTRMNDLIEQNLALGRAEAGRPEIEPVELQALCSRLVDEMLSTTSHRSPIHLHMEHLEEPAASDQAMLRSIITNLLSNAVKYTAPGTPIELRVTRAADRLTILVRDHGHGLDEAEIPKLFTSFHRGSDTAGIPGTGLGLAIVKRCAETLGGSIRARNAEGGGAEFIVELPLLKSET